MKERSAVRPEAERVQKRWREREGSKREGMAPWVAETAKGAGKVPEVAFTATGE